jgi:YcaO-like protein with predicted kinase domain
VTAGAPSPVERGPKGFRKGTHRTVAPEETLRRVSALARSMGITRVANITGLDVIGVPVVAVMRPNSRSIAVAQGKGLDLAAAKVSGLMESIENHHAEHIGLPLVLASYAEIGERGGARLDLDAMPRVAGSVFHPQARLLWVRGREVFSRQPIWLPFETVHTDYTLPLPTGSGAFPMSDSGLASGNHPLEALSHAVCELVERDAMTLWHHATAAQRRETRVALDTVDDAACRWVLGRFERAGVAVAVWEVTSDVGIPAFYCTLVDASPSPWRPLCPASGSGCHPCREVALLRALTEAAQTRLTVIAGSRDDIGVATYARGRDPEVLSAALATMKERGAMRAFRDVPTYVAATLHDDVAWELERLEGAGIQQMAVVDLTLPQYGIPVVRVVIPGLESMHDAPGFTPGARVRARLS